MFNKALIIITLGLSTVVNANQIDFKGTITEDTCSSISDSSACVKFYEIIEKNSNENTTAKDVSTLLTKEKNDFAAVSVEEVASSTSKAAVVLASYY